MLMRESIFKGGAAMLDDIMPVMAALAADNKPLAQRLLQPMLQQNPTADLWVLAARASTTRAQAESCLGEALALNPNHGEAKQLLRRLRGEVDAVPVNPANPPPKSRPRRFTQPATVRTAAPASTESAPPASPIKRIQQPAAPTPSPTVAPTLTEADLPPLKQVRRGRKRGAWWGVGCISMIVLSLTASYVMLLLLGSSLPGQLRAFLSGGAPPVFSDAPDAVYRVPPSHSSGVERNETRSDVLEPGYAHAVVFEAARGDEIAIAIQFFSPTAQRVGRNVAILDPNGHDAGMRCQRNQLFGGDSGAAYICMIDVSGTWMMRVYGREGESSGAYFVSVDKL